MMNLFEGVRKMTDDEIRMQIALFRNVTLLNAAKETSGKVLGGLADIANAFAESFSKRTPFDFQVTRVCDMVRKEYDRLKANEPGAVRIRTQKNSDRKMQGAGAGRIRRAG